MTSRDKASNVLNTLFRRCVECPPVQPSCPSCASDETCSLIPQSCDQCPSTTCVKIGQFPGSTGPPQKSSTPVGPIVGGVVGGLLAILLGAFLVWYCCARPRRRKDTWTPPEKRDQSTLARGDNRTHSIASTVLTRASNVIQIAYIPGVTGRSAPGTPEITPPMPSLSHGTPHSDTHFFMPGDLRSSTWSDASFDPRISLAPSLARASVATTVYRESAVVPPIPAQHAFRAQANVVSVKQAGASNGTSPSVSRGSPRAQTPRMVNIQNSSIVARQVVARPIELKKTGAGNLVPTSGNLARQNSSRTTSPAGSDTAMIAPEEKEIVNSPVTDIADSPTLDPSTPILAEHRLNLGSDGGSTSGISAMSPSDTPRAGVTHRHTNSGGLTAMIEDAIKSASSASLNSPRPTITRHDSGPFSDIHELPSGKE